ncbi:phosphatidylglycerophosphatase A family protein [Echinimonas agarilytica]|uniref:Phosphatidylglycerophosphatase A n=1 Tax=Echinimonas agarilytica TaxID=1215918 RepID=A0AA42B826_9GAMM|nr:phosphatidylglycerophosphatase A [Echinimonas agarilytica]MCM2680542.1 phosphatidylglycerophosphatase A [Echinimonas agarilytica]
MTKTNKKPLKPSTLTHWLAVGFGSGLAPKAPGTFGTIAALPIVWAMSYLSLYGFLAVTLVSCVVGIYLCGKTAEDFNYHDHPGIVWDEFAGMMITMIAVPMTWQYLLAGFILFRIFDILKPWPISWLDKHVDGGFGIMIDDILAGLMALGCMHLGMMWLN